jgi:creatinine amidohydrolase/Fe(II)-dependent formamide hydrolase-like protein
MDRAVFLTDMTWPEVKARLRKVRLAILPTGSMEQHGPHLTFETDIAITTRTSSWRRRFPWGCPIIT